MHRTSELSFPSIVEYFKAIKQLNPIKIKKINLLNIVTYEGQYREGVKIGHWTFTLPSPPPEPHCPYCAG
jgi:hypothetical protein